MAKFRRYITQDQADELRRGGQAECTPTHQATFNLVTQDTTEWYVVHDEDPRIGTVEQVAE